MKHVGWDTTTMECTWCHSGDFGDMQAAESDGAMIAKAGKKEGFKVLGTMFSFDGNDARDLRYRTDQVKKLFFDNRRILADRRKSVTAPLRLAERLLNPAQCGARAVGIAG